MPTRHVQMYYESAGQHAQQLLPITLQQQCIHNLTNIHSSALAKDRGLQVLPHDVCPVLHCTTAVEASHTDAITAFSCIMCATFPAAYCPMEQPACCCLLRLLPFRASHTLILPCCC
jgi:hypothetical protein